VKFYLRLFLLSLLLLDARSSSAFNIYRVGSPVIGQEHNDVWKKWFPRTLTMWVGIDGKTEYLLFQVDTGLGDATVRIKYSKAVQEKLRTAVKKAIEWSEVAKKNEVDTTKPLGCWGDDLHKICEKDGNAFDENQVGMSFFAANEGKQTNLVVDIVDLNNQFIKATLYIDTPQMILLLTNIEGIDEALKKARDTAKKKDLFK
jgi:hypothetical protein